MRKLLLLTVIFPVFQGFAQDKEKEKDEQYVEKIKSIISFRPFATQNWDFLILNHAKSVESPLLYRPATGLNIGGEFAFSFLRFTYQRNVPLLQPVLPAGFKSGNQRFGLDIGGAVFGLSATFQKNKGFYLVNPGAYPLETGEVPESVKYRSDITSSSFGIDFRFTFSTKLSANALFNQTERQLKSKGAFTLVFGDHYHDFNADTLLPPVVRPLYNESASMTRLWSNTFHVMPGYGYIAVAGKWNIGLFLYSGSGIQFRKYYNATEEKLSLRFPLVGKAKGGITYNGHNFYGRLTGSADFTSLGMKDADFRWFQSFWEFSIGLRFYEKNK